MHAKTINSLTTFMRSAGVGIAATLLDLGALALLIQVVRLTPSLANLPALLFGVATQFVGNKLFAFRAVETRGLAKQGWQFLLVEGGALLLNAVLFQLAVSLTPVPYLAARVLVSALVYLAYSYPLWTRIFRAGPAAC